MGILSFIKQIRKDASKERYSDIADLSKSVRHGVSFAGSLGLENLDHSYGAQQVLCDVSLFLKPGEIISLLGPSGSGKSTLLRIAAGLEQQNSGRVMINEYEMAGPNRFIPPEKRGIGHIFQDFALFPHLTVIKNVAFGLRHLARAERANVANIALRRVGLSQKANAYPHMLSGGEQQRVALARAMAPRPNIVLMDEPFSSLDSRLRDQIREQCIDIVRETRASAIMVTHDPEEAMRVSDRICLLKKGRLMQIGTPSDLYERPSSLFAARFFSEANLFYGSVSGGYLNTIFGPVAARDLKSNVEGVLCVREDGFDFSRTLPKEDGSPLRFVNGIIKERRLLGGEELFTILLEGHETPVSARFPCHHVIAGHQKIYLRPQSRQRLVFESEI